MHSLNPVDAIVLFLLLVSSIHVLGLIQCNIDGSWLRISMNESRLEQ